VYGIGALLYEALTGQPAVRARTWVEAAEIHRRGAPPPTPEVPGLPPRVAELCVACLSPDPRDRPSAAAVADVLYRPRPGAGSEPASGAARARPAPPGVAPRRSRVTLVRRAATVVAAVTAPRADTAPGADARPVVGSRRSAGLSAWRRTSRTRLAGVALLGAAAAGVLVLALAVAALLDRRVPGAEAVAGSAVTVTPAPATAPATTPAPTPEATPTQPGPAAPAAGPTALPATSRPADRPDPATGEPSPTAVVDEFDRRLADAAAAGLVRADVAVDLRNGLTDLRDRIGQGRSGELRQRAENLRRKLAERVAERAIDARTAAQLTTVLGPLLAA
jgi:serine/threonine-protein kinase